MDSLRLGLNRGTIGLVETIMGLRWFATVLALLSFLNLYVVVFYSENLSIVNVQWLKTNIGLADIIALIVLLPAVLSLTAPSIKQIFAHAIIWSLGNVPGLYWLKQNPSSYMEMRKDRTSYAHIDNVRNFAVIKDNDIAFKVREEHLRTVEETQFISRMTDSVVFCMLSALWLSGFSLESFLFLPLLFFNLAVDVSQFNDLAYSVVLGAIYTFPILFIFAYSFRDRSLDDYVYLPDLARVINEEVESKKAQSKDSRVVPPPLPPALSSNETLST